MLQTLLGRKKYEEEMSDDQPYPAKSNPSGNENKNSSQKLLEIV